jgi:hypothetical protein
LSWPVISDQPGEAGPHLLAVDDPLVADADGTRREAREVRAGTGLRVADREVHLTSEDLRQEVLLLLLGTEAADRRPNGSERQEGEGKARTLNLIGEDVLLDQRPALAAVLLRPADAEQAVRAHLLQRFAVLGAAALAAALQLGGECVAHHGFEVGADLRLELLLLGGEIDLHGGASDSMRGAGAVCNLF